MGKVIGVVNNKGGSSKTTMSLNIAGELSKKGSVCVVDLDSQKNATIVLSNEKVQTLYTIYDYIFKGKDLEGVKSKSVFDNIDFITGSSKLTQHLSDSNVNILLILIEELKDLYDFIVIDTPPTLDEKVSATIIASDLIVTPIILDLFSVRGLEAVAGEFEQSNYNVGKMLVVPVQVVHNSKLHKEVYKQLKEYIKSDVVKNYMSWMNLSKNKVSYSVEVSNSIARNEILTLGSRSKVGKQLSKVGEEVFEYVR